MVGGKPSTATLSLSPSKRASKVRSVARDLETRVVRLPVPSPARDSVPRSTPSDPVVPFVPPTKSGWETSCRESVRKVTADAPFDAHYCSDRTTLPN